MFVSATYKGLGYLHRFGLSFNMWGKRDRTYLVVIRKEDLSRKLFSLTLQCKSMYSDMDPETILHCDIAQTMKCIAGL